MAQNTRAPVTDRDQHDYWEARAGRGFTYRGERLYTVTPAGFYVRRRRRLMARLEAMLAALPAGAAMLDFGCGDGYYADHLAGAMPGVNVHGCDATEGMVRLARERGGPGEFAHGDGGIPFDRDFEAILVVAVLAHAADGDLEPVAADLLAHLAPGGRLIVFEAVTLGEPTAGRTWRRRRPEAYRELFGAAGLTLTDQELIAYPFYNRVGRRLCHFLARRCFGGDFIRANGNWWYQRLTDLAMMASPALDRAMRPREGNMLMVFQRPQPAGEPH